MKRIKCFFIVMASMLMMAMTSCVNENIGGGIFNSKTGVADLDEQSAAVETSLNAIDEIQGSLSEYADNGRVKGLEAALNNLSAAETALENHIAYLEGGVSLLDGTMATLAMQKQLAEAVGEVEGSLMLSGVEVKSINKQFNALEESVKDWIGKSYEMLYGAVETDTKVQYLLSDLEGKLFNQKVSVGGLLSDIEAGLRDKEFYAELSSLSETVESNETVISELERSVSGIADQLEIEYGKAIEAVASTDYDFDALAKLNEGAGVTLLESSVSLDDLVARIQQCEADIESLKERVGEVEGKVEELLGLIQSLTFVSEYAEDKAVACYSLKLDGTPDAEGKYPRIPDDDITLNYIVRPAAAVTALADMQNWTANGVSMAVKAYYAEKISTADFDKEFLDFDIKSVSGDSNTGILTLTVDPSELNEDFYMKRIGAKLALSLQVDTKKDTEITTDIMSKFVEIQPVDNSGTVYVESLKLSADNIEIDFGTTDKIVATVTPANATEIGVEWESGNITYVTIDENGTIEGAALGTAVITATTKGTDEWGRELKAQCTVKVNPAIKLIGLDYVEEGGETSFQIQSPDYISSESVTWEIGTYTSKNKVDGTPIGFSTNQQYATIDNTGKITGLKMYYNISESVKAYVPLAVKCTIAASDTIVLYQDIHVIAKQPLGISINELSDAENQISTKIGKDIGLYGTMKPDGVSTDYFKLSYLGAYDGYFYANNEGPSTVTVSIENGGTGQYSYFYPKGKRISRNITVVVEPYYVQSVSLPATFEMNLDMNASITPTLTSDAADDTPPTHPELVWSSTKPEVVSIDEETGVMTSKSEGWSIITATTSHENAVPSGQPQISAQCTVTVKKPQNPINIGDYYYDDGSWSTERDDTKNVIGIVFAKVNAAAEDVQMSVDHAECSNGLVVSTAEYLTPMMENGASFSRNTYFNWMNNNGYTQAQDTEKCSGYGTTKGMEEINSASVKDDYGTVYFDLCEPIITHRTAVPAPGKSSGWYLPSYKEMTLLYDNFDAVNASIQNVGGTVMTKNYAFTNSSQNNQYYCTYVNNGSNWVAFDMNSAAIVSNGKKIDLWTTTTIPKAEWPIRVILAF